MNSVDTKKLLTGLVLALAGAAATWATQAADGLAGTDLGYLAPLVGVAASVGLNALRKYLSPTPAPEVTPEATPEAPE